MFPKRRKTMLQYYKGQLDSLCRSTQSVRSTIQLCCNRAFFCTSLETNKQQNISTSRLPFEILLATSLIAETRDQQWRRADTWSKQDFSKGPQVFLAALFLDLMLSLGPKKKHRSVLHKIAVNSNMPWTHCQVVFSEIISPFKSVYLHILYQCQSSLTLRFIKSSKYSMQYNLCLISRIG